MALPADIGFLVVNGNFISARKKIELRLKDKLPSLLKSRLEYEVFRMERIKKNYTINEEEAKRMLSEEVKDFSEDEFVELTDLKLIDYMVIEGERFFEKRFLSNLFFASEKYSVRRVNPDAKKLKSNELLHETIDRLLSGAIPRKYRIRAKISSKINEDAQIKGELVRCWLPLPRKDVQQDNINIISSSHKLLFVSGEHHPSRTVFMEDKLENNPLFEIEFEYDIQEMTSSVDPSQVRLPKSDMSEFLREKSPHMEFTCYLKNLAREIVGNEKNPYFKAKMIYDWITKNVKYSFMSEYRIYENISQFAAINLRGDCGVQALLFITLCRICSIPARWQSGWYANPVSPGNHDWAMFYIEPYGWLPVDCSFGGARRNNESYREFYFGNLDAYRMIANSSFMADFSPRKSHMRNDPYDNQNGEMETELQPVFPEDADSNTQIIKVTPLD